MATYTVTGAVAGVPLGIKPQIVEVVLDFFVYQPHYFGLR